MDKSEARIDSNEVYSGRVIRVTKDLVRLADGTQTTREVILHRGAVCIVPVSADGSITLVRQYRYAAGKELLEAPAGTLEVGEDPLDCAKRELEEETGLACQAMEQMFTAYLAPGYSSELMHFYLAKDCALLSTPRAGDEDERIDTCKVKVADIETLIRSEQIQDAKTISALLYSIRLMS